MNKEEVKQIFYENQNTIKDYYSGNNHNVVENFRYDLIINTILSIVNSKISELEAKVYTYEKIIANSNFKSINNKSIESLNKKIKELEKELEILKEGDDNE